MFLPFSAKKTIIIKDQEIDINKYDNTVDPRYLDFGYLK